MVVVVGLGAVIHEINFSEEMATTVETFVAGTVDITIKLNHFR